MPAPDPYQLPPEEQLTPKVGTRPHNALHSVIHRSPDPIASLERVGSWIAKSGLFGCDRIEQGNVIALTCLCEGITPLEFRRTYDVIGNSIRMKAAAQLAHFHRMGGQTRWVDTGQGGERAKAIFGWKGQEVAVEYTMDRARQAGLLRPGSGWTKNPDAMLRARVISTGLTMLAPEISSGEYDNDEIPSIADTPLSLPVTHNQGQSQREVTDENEIQTHTVVPPNPPAGRSPNGGGKGSSLNAASGLPVPPPTPAEQEGTGSNQTLPAPPRETIPPELYRQLMEVAGDTLPNLERTRAWLEEAGWLAVGAPLEEIPLKLAQSIVSKPALFRERVLGIREGT